MREDFTRTGITAFACAFPAFRITTLRRQPTEMRTDIVVVEAHSADEHLRAERDLIELKPGHLMLGAMSKVESACDSLYAGLLIAEHECVHD
jgi:hypothetical protein